jgi:lipopolysaccharide cholinephosphotransferase
MMTHVDSDGARRIQLEVLDDFARFCDDAGYRWWLCAGTLLGAARHHGFIPWDDDIDVAMPRQDFDRLCSDPRVAGTGRSLASLETDPAYPFPYAKLYDTRTRVVEHYDPMPRYGIGIDIFPVDRWPASARNSRLLELALIVLRGCLGVRIVRPETLRGPRRKWVARTGRIVLSTVPPAVFARVLTSIVRRVPAGTGAQGVIVWGYEEKVAPGAFDDDTTLSFEGRDLPVPSGWSEWLTAAYGDWATPPPPRERAGHPHLKMYRVDE